MGGKMKPLHEGGSLLRRGRELESLGMPEVEVTPLRLAQLELSDFHPEAPGSDTIHGFLVRDGADCILMDTGVGTGSALIDRLYKPERVELSTALAQAGASLAQVTAIVNSHLHFDHCGNNPLFPGVPIFVQQAELAASRQSNYTVPEWVDFAGANYVPVHGKHSISARLELLPTPGHTPGHQSLLMHSGSDTEVIVAQAAHTAAEFQLFQGSGIADPDDRDYATLRRYVESNATWSEESYMSSLAALWRLHPRRAFFSHDALVWRRED